MEVVKENERRILALVPTGKDASVAWEVLAKAGIAVTVCTDMAALCRTPRERLSKMTGRNSGGDSVAVCGWYERLLHRSPLADERLQAMSVEELLELVNELQGRMPS